MTMETGFILILTRDLNFRVSHINIHFQDLKDVTYCYQDQALRTPFCIDEDESCSRCEASQLLDPYGEYDSSARLQILSSRFEQHCVRLSALEEQAEG